MADPWSSAEAGTSTSGTSQVIPEQPAQSSGLGGGALFNGGGNRVPSLFNKTHPAGTERTGVITDIKDVHSRALDRDDKTGKLTPGGLKYWEDGNSGKGVKPVTTPVSTITGKPNRPVMDTHIKLDTQYRMDATEARAIQRDESFIAEDKGERAYVINDVKVVQEAIKAFNEANPSAPITEAQHLIGKRLTVKRLNMPGERRDEVVRITAS